MKTILIINDGSTAVASAAIMALQIARSQQAGVLIAQTYRQTRIRLSTVLAGNHPSENSKPANEAGELSEMLRKLNEGHTGFRPGITTTELPDTDAAGVAELALRLDCWLIVRGCGQMGTGRKALDYQTLLNKLRCPLLLVPERPAGLPIRHITYIADLRYCRHHIMRYLSNLANRLQANVSLAHISAEGLMPIEENYGRALFEEVCRQTNSGNFTFNNIREPDIRRAVDVLINGLHNDLLVLINHRYHFKAIIGQRLTEQLPEGIDIPLLLFPL